MLLRLLTIGLSCLVLLPTANAEPIQATLLLKNAQILDGTLTPPQTGNVAIANGIIVAVGEFEVTGTPWTLDCTGMIVCPGFIDLHNHSDRPITEPPARPVRREGELQPMSSRYPLSLEYVSASN